MQSSLLVFVHLLLLLLIITYIHLQRVCLQLQTVKKCDELTNVLGTKLARAHQPIEQGVC